MMTSTQLFWFCNFWVSITGIAIVWFWLYQDYEMDRFRHKLFEIRDDLFDYANAGHISFSNPAYCDLRVLINGMVEYAVKISFWEMMVLSVPLIILRRSQPTQSFDRKFESDLALLNKPASREMRKFRNLVQKASITHIARGSFVLCCGVVLLAISYAVSVILKAVFQGTRGAFKKRQKVRSMVEDTVFESLRGRVPTQKIEECALLLYGH